MTFQWKLLKPARPISRQQKKIAIQIAQHYLETGQGSPIHDLNMQLREKRNVLVELDQLGLIQNDAGKYYPTFPTVSFLPAKVRNSYAGYLHYMMKAIQILYERNGPNRYPIFEVTKRMGEAIKQDDGAKLGRNNTKPIIFERVALFLAPFRESVMTEPHGALIQSVVPTQRIIDYKNLSGAWKLELKLPQNLPAYLKPTNPTPAAPTPKEIEPPNIVKDKAKKVFVIHGRDERLRAALFDFLRALHLEPLEWNTAMSLTAKAAPYIGEVLDAAFNHAQAAVVLLSPDDEVKLRDDLIGPNDGNIEKTLTGQARPNVLFEAGMAFASHQDRTVLVQFGQVKPFSDVAGRHVVHMDGSVSKRQELALKLKTAGCPVYMDGTDWHKSGDLTLPQIMAPTNSGEQITAIVETIPRNLAAEKRWNRVRDEILKLPDYNREALRLLLEYGSLTDYTALQKLGQLARSNSLASALPGLQNQTGLIRIVPGQPATRRPEYEQAYEITPELRPFVQRYFTEVEPD